MGKFRSVAAPAGQHAPWHDLRAIGREIWTSFTVDNGLGHDAARRIASTEELYVVVSFRD
jgi:hypothetical protein